MGLTDADVAISAALAGAEVVARDYGHPYVSQAKGRADTTSETDLAAEQAIMAVLSEHRPRDPRLGEETGASGEAGSGRRWLVDPMCGTVNFAATTPLIAVNVALVDREGVSVAAVADPVAGEIFWTDGRRSYHRSAGRDHVLVPDASSRLVDVNCDGPAGATLVGGQLIGDSRLRSEFAPRVLATSLAVAWVAAGRRAAYISDGQFRDNVHFAAGIALCIAAGCVVSDLAGEELYSGRGLLVSADAATHRSLVKIVRPHLDAVLERS